MNRLILALLLTLCLAANGAVAQQSAAAKQFDFLIGHWSIELTPKVSSLAALMHGTPKLLGSWKAWRAFDGRGIEDELRVTDSSGNPQAFNHTLRLYDADGQRWKINGLDVYRAQMNLSEAQLRGGLMQVDGKGSSHSGDAYISRSRFIDVSDDSFRMQQDRSYDGGASWEEETLVIVAKRVSEQAQR